VKENLVISYIKYSYRGFILWILIFLLLNWLSKFESLSLDIFYLVISLIGGFYRYNDQLEKIKKLKAKGLTEQDLINIEFVKSGRKQGKAVFGNIVSETEP